MTLLPGNPGIGPVPLKATVLLSGSSVTLRRTTDQRGVHSARRARLVTPRPCSSAGKWTTVRHLEDSGTPAGPSNLGPAGAPDRSRAHCALRTTVLASTTNEVRPGRTGAISTVIAHCPAVPASHDLRRSNVGSTEEKGRENGGEQVFRRPGAVLQSCPACGREGFSVSSPSNLVTMAGSFIPRSPLGERVAACRAAILATAAKRHVSNVRAFGSVVRGGDTADSDVDLLVDMDPTASPLDLLALGCDLEDALDVKVDIGTPETLRRLLRDEVLAEAVPL